MLDRNVIENLTKTFLCHVEYSIDVFVGTSGQGIANSLAHDNEKMQLESRTNSSDSSKSFTWKSMTAHLAVPTSIRERSVLKLDAPCTSRILIGQRHIFQVLQIDEHR